MKRYQEMEIIVNKVNQEDVKKYISLNDRIFVVKFEPKPMNLKVTIIIRDFSLKIGLRKMLTCKVLWRIRPRRRGRKRRTASSILH